MKRTPRTARNLLWLAVLLLAAGPLLADDVLEIARRTGSRLADGRLLGSNEERGILYLGVDNARFDQGTNVTWILRRGEGVLFLVRHDAKTYERLPLPVRFENYLAEPQRSRLSQMLPGQTPALSTQATTEARTIRGYPSRRFVIEGSPPRESIHFRYDLWMTTELPIDLGLYRDLLRSSGALDLQLRGAAEQIAELPGFPVERDGVVKEKSGRESFDHRSLLSVAKRDLPSSFYQPPTGYREIPFQTGRWVDLTPLAPIAGDRQ